MKKIVYMALISLLLVSCGQSGTNQQTSSSQNGEEEVLTSTETITEKIDVTTSIIPLASLVNTIGGDFVEVNTLVPSGVSPHGFDLSARQMVEVEKSDIIFLVGLEEIDGFLEKSSPVEKQVHLADGIELLAAAAHSHEEEAMHEEEHEDEHHEDEHAHDKDTHVWLGKDNIIQIAQKVRDELSMILPEQALYFSQNTDTFITELEKIYADFTIQTAGKSPREFIVFHDAYNYLMQSVGMDLDLRVPFSENVLQETGTAHRAELIEEVELHGVKYVFREPQFSDSNLQKFANEYNLSIGILDPLGTDASAEGYFQNLRNNLESLSVVYE